MTLAGRPRCSVSRTRSGWSRARATRAAVVILNRPSAMAWYKPCHWVAPFMVVAFYMVSPTETVFVRQLFVSRALLVLLPIFATACGPGVAGPTTVVTRERLEKLLPTLSVKPNPLVEGWRGPP